MVGNKPHWVDKDARRLRLRCLPKHTFSNVAFVNIMIVETISIRNCTGKKGGRFLFVIMWQPEILNTRHAPRERSANQVQSVFVSSVPLSQLWVESFNPSQWVILLFWATVSASIGDTPAPPALPGGMNQNPPAPPL
jgi:hypothetical protein